MTTKEINRIIKNARQDAVAMGLYKEGHEGASAIMGLKSFMANADCVKAARKAFREAGDNVNDAIDAAYNAVYDEFCKQLDGDWKNELDKEWTDRLAAIETGEFQHGVEWVAGIKTKYGIK